MNAVYLFGVGGAASWVLAGFRRGGVDVTGFLDEAPGDRKLVCGLPVFHPDKNEMSASERSSAVVVIAIMNPAADLDAIIARQKKYGWGKVQTFVDFGAERLASTGKHCGMLAPGRMPAKEIEAVAALMSDAHSRDLVRCFARFVETFDETGLPPITPLPYFPEDLPRWTSPMRIIDCGAFDGDSLRAADAAGYKLEASASFEPDPVNFRLLAANIRDRPGAEAWPCGVADRTCMLHFAAEGGTGSSIQERGEVSIQCVSMDDALPGFVPTLIKMDVEGAEEDALHGADHILRRYAPGLAISVYHRSTDIWRIPLWLSERYPAKTRWFLRRHSRTIADTVLYVFPPNTSTARPS